MKIPNATIGTRYVYWYHCGISVPDVNITSGLDVRFAPWNGICSWRLNWSKSMVKKVTVLMKEFTTDIVKNCLLGNSVCL